jgi:geranylgeranyl diphosphate synthase, type I
MTRSDEGARAVDRSSTYPQHVETVPSRPLTGSALDWPGPSASQAGDPLDAEDLRTRLQKVIDDHLARQQARLEEIGPEMGVLLEGIAELLSGGKRLRAAFCYWAWRGAGGADCAEIVTAASGLECFQAAALLHDDVMDRSDTRRGRPSMHRHVAGLHDELGWSGDSARFGEAAAILAGDLCLAWSDELLATSGLPAATIAAGRETFDTMRTQLMGGQYLDVLEQAVGGGDIERALLVVRYKSAKYTVEQPLLLGAAMAGAGPELLAGLSAYGLPLGEAFQLRDDILGVFGDPDITGKPAGDDLREGKRTVLIAQVERLGTPAEIDTVRSHLGDARLDDSGVRAVRAAIQGSGALDAVESMIEDRASAASAALVGLGLGEPAAGVLAALVQTATSRQA